ncbi:hypothetical protein AB1Y20_010042 [Prymnesium parvum]|uniref:G domain-containing protein n=1 Tax=Prymnesium parvum TaxID=97485 RepID=A0AB34K2K5_PRYPA
MPDKRSPPRGSAPQEPTSVTEQILKEVHEMYVLTDTGAPLSSSIYEPVLRPALLTPGKEGIMAICSKLGLKCIAPRRKINVMIVGNHSAGKSSYINWYIGEPVQKAGIAIETQGFTFCTSGKQRTTLKGEATLQLFQHFIPEVEPFKPAIYNGLQTEISTSKNKCFNLITFIDTPGLVDGSFHYPYPVEDAIVSIAKHSDLIYIFFDPIGQALCDRTMKTIEMLNRDHAEKLRYFLSKADTVPDEMDRQKVVVQITQNLSSRIRNAHAFELPSIYIPDKTPNCTINNAVEKTCEEMESTILQSVQNNLNNLERDCRRVASTIDAVLADDKEKRKFNRTACCYGNLIFLSALQLPVLAIAILTAYSRAEWFEQLGTAAPSAFRLINRTADILLADEAGPDGTGTGLLSVHQFLFYTLAVTTVLFLASRIFGKYQPYYSKRELANLIQTKQYVMEHLLERKASLYKLYFDQSVSELQ